MEFTIKDYIDDGLIFAFQVNNMQRYEGILYGKLRRLYLTENNLEDLKEFENIYNELNNSFKLIKIFNSGNGYMLQVLDLKYEGPYNENAYYMLEDYVTSNDLIDLLKKYDNKIKEKTNVKTK